MAMPPTTPPMRYLRDPDGPRERVLTGTDPNLCIQGGVAHGSPQHRAVEGSGYVTREGEAWVRREAPKVKGKAARKAAKKLRHRQRARGATGTPNTEG